MMATKQWDIFTRNFKRNWNDLFKALPLISRSVRHHSHFQQGRGIHVSKKAHVFSARKPYKATSALSTYTKNNFETQSSNSSSPRQNSTCHSHSPISLSYLLKLSHAPHSPSFSPPFKLPCTSCKIRIICVQQEGRDGEISEELWHGGNEEYFEGVSCKRVFVELDGAREPDEVEVLEEPASSYFEALEALISSSSRYFCTRHGIHLEVRMVWQIFLALGVAPYYFLVVHTQVVVIRNLIVAMLIGRIASVNFLGNDVEQFVPQKVPEGRKLMRLGTTSNHNFDAEPSREPNTARGVVEMYLVQRRQQEEFTIELQLAATLRGQFEMHRKRRN
ncbi:uncharacterized protein BDR25DRAFT_348523 [Lindgomyces ingoldianus]|uniref:Uncharacterized protein n=1 Tax=Lindgomyces ingoldianus TaxID=673940 RepID=A0ACB6RGC3_9PLEO|nr:uncharacterized protein BDR25DRAFT_348523 [Lindgomyces ingoldianus]KAF2478261.1 hypothetical protein BDR25DRAFT_348523 [Lindgomyces ingoldianus]